jgi:probable HAF family extracellular repeat protein
MTAILPRAATLAVLSAALCASAAPRYHLVDLGAAGESWSAGVNDHGLVAGYVADTPALYHDGAWRNLKGAQPFTTRVSNIDASGAVTGWLEGNPKRAVVWKLGGKRIVLPNINPDDPLTSMGATALMDDGTVIGWAGSVDTPEFMFRWKRGGSGEILGTPPGGDSPEAAAVNKRGQIVGHADFAGERYPGHAFLYDAGNWTDLGTLGGEDSWAVAINLGGQIVGCSQDSHGDNTPFIYSDQQMSALPTPAGTHGCATGIANDGTIGGYDLDDKKVSEAFIYQGGVRYDDIAALADNGAGWNLRAIDAVAPNGVMVGHGAIHRTLHTFLLKPLSE